MIELERQVNISKDISMIRYDITLGIFLHCFFWTLIYIYEIAKCSIHKNATSLMKYRN